MANKIIYSEYQKNVLDYVLNGKGNLIINAVAGSGKTFIISECCKQLGMRKQDCLFLAFNRSIRDELQKKIGDYSEVNTTHQFGLRCLYRCVGRNIKIKIDDNKYRKIIEDMVDKSNNEWQKILSNAVRLLELCRANLIQANDSYAIENLIKHHDLSVIANEIRIVRELLQTAYELDMNNPVIDFVDMIVLPLSYKNRIPKYRMVFIDECQDLNTAQRELMSCAASRGRFVAVGDPNQAINGFAGADCDSFQQIADLPYTKSLPLSVNYRCGTSMIDLAKQIVPQIEAHEGAIEGLVDTINNVTIDTFQNNDMVLCRTTAPLVATCLKLIRAGRTAIVMGRDIAKGLKSMIEKSKAKTIKGFESWVDVEKAKLAKEIAKKEHIAESEAEQTGRYVAFMDRVACILAFGDTETKLDKVIARLDTIFSDDNVQNAITLCTAHKSKGLERERVLILLPHKLPLTWKGQLEWQYQQELNLRYVALTRAKKELVFVNLELADLLKLEFNN